YAKCTPQGGAVFRRRWCWWRIGRGNVIASIVAGGSSGRRGQRLRRHRGRWRGLCRRGWSWVWWGVRSGGDGRWLLRWGTGRGAGVNRGWRRWWQNRGRRGYRWWGRGYHLDIDADSSLATVCGKDDVCGEMP